MYLALVINVVIINCNVIGVESLMTSEYLGR